MLFAVGPRCQIEDGEELVCIFSYGGKAATRGVRGILAGMLVEHETRL